MVARLERVRKQPAPSLMLAWLEAGLLLLLGFRAFDSHTGQMLWEGRLESEGHTTPMTYMARNGKQYVVVMTSGVNAFALE